MFDSWASSQILPVVSSAHDGPFLIGIVSAPALGTSREACLAGPLRPSLFASVWAAGVSVGQWLQADVECVGRRCGGGSQQTVVMGSGALL